MEIEDIQKMQWESNDQEKTFTILAVINRISEKIGWYYLACDICRKKLKPKEDSFCCDDCDRFARTPIPRYMLQIEVEDSKATTNFVLFDREAEKLLGLPAIILMEKQNNTPEEKPLFFQKD
ncbi:hypothetical protein M5689_018942 [Euphorbia peplus]|nr:hypothetical protein M5689_018942 [Euphorbia peplus]